MTVTNRITGAITLCLGALVTVIAAGMPLLDDRVPGPGLLPLFAGLALVVFGILLLVRPSNDSSPAELPPRDAPWQVAGAVGGVLLFTAVVPLLGFPIATALFLTGLIWWWGKYRWWVAALGSVLISLVMMLVFQILLDAPLPKGVWG